MGGVVERTQCPQCASKGGDSKGDNLAVYEDGSDYCHACGYNSRKKRREGTRMESKPADISRYLAYPTKALTHKPISKEICERYGVRVITSETDGSIAGVLYPYYTEGQVTGFKVRQLPKQFRFAGDANKIGMFGQQLYKAGGRMLVIAEGEDDALAIAEMFKTKGKNYSVVSIPTGADQNGKLDKKIKENYTYLSSFENVVIALDNDEAGRATAKSLADWLAPTCTVRVVDLPEGVKDASDMLLAGDTEGWLECFRKAREYTPEGIVDGCDINLDDLKVSPEIGYSTPYPGLDDKLKGLRKGELTLFTAGSGIGKSTITREIGYHFVKRHGLSVANIMLEEPLNKSVLGYIALDNNVPLSSLWMNRTLIADEQFEKSGKELIQNGRNFFFSHFGSMSLEGLMSALRYYANAKDVDFIILDHISMVVSGMQTDNERKVIDLLMTELAAFCNETGTGVLAVVHLKRKNTNGGKDKALNEGGQVSLTDLRGSGGLEQLSWSVVALERNQQDIEEANYSTVRVLKNRMFGFTGSAGRLWFNPETGRLLPAPEPIDYQE